MEPEVTGLRVACADLNGQMRGKRLAGTMGARVEFEGVRLPLSTLALDLFGQVPSGAPAGPANGDPDGQLRVTDRGPVPMPWLRQPTALMPMWMFTDDGRPCGCDPRHALARVLARWTRHGWTPRVSTLLEVCLVDDTGPDLAPAAAQGDGRAPARGHPASVARLDGFAPFLDDVQAGADAMGIALESVETGATPGQIRLGLGALPALRAADDLWLLKALLRGTARAHDMAACFLARPFADAPGNAVFVAFRAEDRDRRNLFYNGLAKGSEIMLQAVAGALSCLPGAMLIFAPFEPSYARYTADSLAPTGAAWGYDNRTAALRIPGGDPAAQRIEHRVPGADSNPYLVLAAILGGAIAGIEDVLAPPEPVIGCAYGQRMLQCPMDLDSAIERFAASPRMARIFSAELIAAMTAVKRQEQRRMAGLGAADVTRALMDAL